jgi:hypothetical protein
MRALALGAIFVVAGAIGLAIAFALGGGGTKTVATRPVPRNAFTVAGLAPLRQDPPIPRFLLERAAPASRVVRRVHVRVRVRVHHARPAPVAVRVAVPRPVPVPVQVVVQRPVVRAPAPRPASPSPKPKPPIVFDDSG